MFILFNTDKKRINTDKTNKSYIELTLKESFSSNLSAYSTLKSSDLKLL